MDVYTFLMPTEKPIHCKRVAKRMQCRAATIGRPDVGFFANPRERFTYQ